MQCRLCEGILPGKRGFTATPWGAFHRLRHDCVIHPIKSLFMAARFTTAEGMEWLRARNLVDDECIAPWGIDPEDVLEILELASFSYDPRWICVIRADYEKRIFERFEDSSCEIPSLA